MAMSNATFTAVATERPPMGGTSGDGSVNGTAVRTTTAAGLSQLRKLQSNEHGRDVRQLSPSQSQMLQQTLDLIGPTPTDAQVGVIAANLGLEHHEVRCRPCGRACFGCHAHTTPRSAVGSNMHDSAGTTQPRTLYPSDRKPVRPSRGPRPCPGSCEGWRQPSP